MNKNLVVHTPIDLAYFEADVAKEDTKRATIAVIVPAYNEQDSIHDVIHALIHQTRMPDVVFVIVNGSDDDTFEIAKALEGRHERQIKGVPQATNVYIHDMGANPDKKVGALNRGWLFAKDFDFVLGVDGDTILDRRCIDALEAEMLSDTRIGGISAIYTVGYEQTRSPFGKFLLAGQRSNFAAFNMENMLRGRRMAVLGGQCSLFRTEAMKAAMEKFRQDTPWVTDSCVEDSLLSIQLKTAGFSTKISSSARAVVGGMTNMKALHGQQVKWNFGALELIKQQPFHPNLRLRWVEAISMIFNIITRLGFAILLTAALSIHAFVFNPLWLIPPSVAVLLQIKIASAIKERDWKDIFFAVFLGEFYTWIRIGHFMSAGAQFASNAEKDLWGAQASAEQGSGGMNWAYPLFVTLAVITGAVWLWAQQSVQSQSSILWFGWLFLYAVTMSQTLFMVKKLFRRSRGYKV